MDYFKLAGITFEIGGIGGFILSYHSNSLPLALISGAAYTFGRGLSDRILKKEILSERKELTDKL